MVKSSWHEMILWNSLNFSIVPEPTSFCWFLYFFSLCFMARSGYIPV